MEKSTLGHFGAVEAGPWITDLVNEREQDEIDEPSIQEALPDLRILELQQQRPQSQSVHPSYSR